MAVESDLQAIATTFAVVLSIALFTTAFVVIAWAAFSWRSQRDLLRVVRDQCDRVAHMRYQGFLPTPEPAGASQPQPAADWQDQEWLATQREDTAKQHREMMARHENARRGESDPAMPPEVTG